MLLKCVQCEDRSGYVHQKKKKKKPGERVLGMLFLSNEWEKRRWVRRRQRWKRGKGERENEGWRLWQEFSVSVSVWLTPRKTRLEQGWESDFSRELWQETLFLRGEGCRSTAMELSQNLFSPKHLCFFLSQKLLCISFIPIFSRSGPQFIIRSLYLLRLSRSRVQAKKALSRRYHISHLRLLTGWRAMKTRSHLSREGCIS